MASVVVISPPCQPLGAEGNRNRLAESVGASLKTFPTPYYVLFDVNFLLALLLYRCSTSPSTVF